MGEFIDPVIRDEEAARVRLRWQFKVAGEVLVWDWSTGGPEPDLLEPMRIPKARMKSRHLPGMPYSMTTGGQVPVESGLELDLFRDLDRRPEVTWLVGQPCLLHSLAAVGKAWEHIPDLLSVATGQVTVWDVRPPARQNQRFRERAWQTREACRQVGWAYEVFGGFSEAYRMNLGWLNSYRTPPASSSFLADAVRAGFTQHGWTTIDDVYDHDLWSGQLVATMWHLVWRGSLGCDLDLPIAPATRLTWLGTR